MSAEAVDAVRCGFRCELSRARPIVTESGSTPGNGTGHSGRQSPNFDRSHMTSTSSCQQRVQDEAAEDLRPPCVRGPLGVNAPSRRSQYGRVQNGQTSTRRTTTVHLPTGLTALASGRAIRAESSATPKKISSVPTTHVEQDLRGAEPAAEQPVGQRGEAGHREERRSRAVR